MLKIVCYIQLYICTVVLPRVGSTTFSLQLITGIQNCNIAMLDEYAVLLLSISVSECTENVYRDEWLLLSYRQTIKCNI